jgi:hypothetical protein
VCEREKSRERPGRDDEVFFQSFRKPKQKPERKKEKVTSHTLNLNLLLAWCLD